MNKDCHCGMFLMESCPIHGHVFKDQAIKSSKIDTDELFNKEKAKHLKNLEEIRNFIFGDENNQPQVSCCPCPNCPKVEEFDKLYHGVKEWLDTAYFDGDDDE